MTTRLRRRLALGLAVGLVALGSAGCSDDSTAASPTPAPSSAGPVMPSGTATTGIAVSGQGYSFDAPSGWADTSAQKKQQFPQVDSSADDLSTSGGLTDNVNVIVSDKRRIKSQAKAERILRRDLGEVGKRVKILDPVDLDGETAYHATARIKVGKIRVRTTQYFAKHDKAWYLLTFSYGPSTDPEAEAEQIQSVLDSWSWKD